MRPASWSLVLGYGHRPRWRRFVVVLLLIFVAFLLGPLMFGFREYRDAQPAFADVKARLHERDLQRVISDVAKQHRVDLTLVDAGGKTLSTSEVPGDLKASVGLRLKDTLSAGGRQFVIHQTRRTSIADVLRSAEFLASGALILMIMTASVVSERRRRFIEFNERLLEDLSDAIEVLDNSGAVVFASASLSRILGVPEKEIIGRQLRDLVSAEDMPLVAAAMNRTEITDDRQPLKKVRMNGAEGIVYIEGTVRAMRNRGKRVGTLVAMHDITETVQLERQVEQSARIESLGRVAASVAHEFNNVLMSVGINTSLLMRRGGLDENARAVCEQLQKSVTRGKRVAEQILRFSRPAELQMKTIAVRDWLTSLEEELKPVLHETTLDVHMPEEELTFLGDEEQLGQVVTNLVLNARDAMNNGGQIAWTVDRVRGGTFRYGIVPQGDFIHLQVSDDGEGIAADKLDRIFEPLYTTKKSGTGLGLTVSYQIVHDHAGLMFAESTVGRGTAMHVFLPAARS